jgi:Domain of unknown function (DUF6458)
MGGALNPSFHRRPDGEAQTPGRKSKDWSLSMALGTSLFLIAIGAILKFAVTVSTRGFNLNTVGIILIVVGIVGMLISLLSMTMWSDRRRRVVAADDPDYDYRAPRRVA